MKRSKFSPLELDEATGGAGFLRSPGPLDSLDFVLPPELEATEPPEIRGKGRDDVRLMVQSGEQIEHARFKELAHFLSPGDLLVINTSGTMNAALHVRYEDSLDLELHLSTHLPADLWSVELRLPGPAGTSPCYTATAGAKLRLPGGAEATLHVPYRRGPETPRSVHNRLWVASLKLPCPLAAYLSTYGYPIRYGHVPVEWPLEYYQTVYATEPGSAEMPSAGRAFTAEMLTELVAGGVQVAPLILHTGVASLEDHEPPYEEFYRVPLQTAKLVNAARKAGKQVVAVGTTVVRALETVTDETGVTHPGQGWTDLVIAPDRPVRSATALLTGLHEPRASHLFMLEAFFQTSNRGRGPAYSTSSWKEHSAANARALLGLAYREALREGYLWHEFGDLHLIMGP